MKLAKVELFEEHGRKNPDNVHVITYRRVLELLIDGGV